MDDSLANVTCGIGTTQGFSVAGHLGQLSGAKELADAVRQVFDAIGLGGSAPFEEKIAVGGFLAGDGADDEERFAEREDFRSCEAARLGNNKVGDGHEFMHVRGVAKHVGGTQ